MSNQENGHENLKSPDNQTNNFRCSAICDFDQNCFPNSNVQCGNFCGLHLNSVKVCFNCKSHVSQRFCNQTSQKVEFLILTLRRVSGSRPTMGSWKTKSIVQESLWLETFANLFFWSQLQRVQLYFCWEFFAKKLPSCEFFSQWQQFWLHKIHV